MVWYIVGYFAIGIFLSCLIQYWKGRGVHSRSVDSVRDLELDLLSAAALAVWPGIILLGISVAMLMVIALPVIKLSEFCANLGRKHRGTE